MNDVRKMIYGTIIGFLPDAGVVVQHRLYIGLWFTFTCNRGDLLVERTPIPTLIPATMPVQSLGADAGAFNKCQVAAVDLIGYWVEAGVPETEKFTFTDVNGQDCEAAKGKDILGGGVWEESLLYQMVYAPDGESLIGRPIMPLGRTADVPDKGPVIFAGRFILSEETAGVTVTPTP
jgi:hypothetical protein